MTDENIFNSSQESLPLSQETFAQLLQLSNQIPNFMNDANSETSNIFSETNVNAFLEQTGDWSRHLQVPTIQNQTVESRHLQVPAIQNQTVMCTVISEPQYAPSSLPGTENWPGIYSFKVSFNYQENAKGLTWVYSKVLNKLYVGKDVSCPVNFSTSIAMTGDVNIRAMVYFSSPNHASEIVHRCINHSMDELSRGLFEAEHLVRCESSMAFYEVDSLKGRHSVTVPFENPPAGQDFSSYIYSFKCFGSCSGGPNRRPMMLVFTLEKGNKVVGRQRIDLKVCACPSRDMRQEDPQDKKCVKRKEVVPIEPTPPSKKMKMAKEDGPYIIKVQDKECFEHLRRMKKLYCLWKLITLKKEFPASIFVYSSASSDEDANAS